MPDSMTGRGLGELDPPSREPTPTVRRTALSAMIAVGLVLLAAVLLAAFAYRLPIPGQLGDFTQAEFANILTGAAAAVFSIGLVVFRGGFLAGLWVSSPLVPGTAAVATVVSYLLTDAEKGVPYLSVAIGLAVTALAWSLAGFICKEVASREVADMALLDELRDRFGQLFARFTELESATVEPASRVAQHKTAIAEARYFLRVARRELHDPALGAPSLRWIMGSGYASIRRTLHRADELIIVAEPRHAVVGDALHDHLSLAGSTIAERDALSSRLANAIRRISGQAAQAFFGLPAGTDTKTEDQPTEEEAREALREVRFAVNTFRDTREEGLVRARNRLVWTMLAVGITSYVAVAVAMLLGVSKTNLIAGIAFYMVAAIVGLFNRLRLESTRGSAKEDHGLFLIRLVTSPLLSGIAGVAGVFLVAASTAVTIPPADDAGQIVAKTFDLTTSQLSLVTAAVFGFAPSQLATALQKQTERLQRDLEKSEPSGGSETDKGEPAG